MRTLVIITLAILSLGFWLAVDQNSDIGKDPRDEELVLTQKRNKVTGELLNVQIIRCKICGQTLYYGEFSLKGKPRMAYVNQHNCGQYDTKVAKYKGLAVGPAGFNLIDWLEGWQKRLRLKR